MTRRRRPLCAALVGVAFLGAGSAASAGDAPVSAPVKKPELPAGVVARVRGQDVLLRDFRLRMVEMVKDELDEPRSGPATVFLIVIEFLVVQQEAARLGIQVSNDDYAREYYRIDQQVRSKSDGAKTLADVIRETGSSAEVTRARLEDMIRKERIASHPTYLGATLPKDERARIAQIEVVMGDLMKKAKIEKTNLSPGVLAVVNGAPLTAERLGQELDLRLGEREVKRLLQEHCLTVVLDQEGLKFTEAQVDDALLFEKPLYERMLDSTIDPQRRALSFDDFLLLRYGAPVSELRSSPYRRGLFALRMRFWRSVTDEDVVRAFGAGSRSQYGASVVVTDVQASFQIQNALAPATTRRPKDEARRLAADIARRGRGGESAQSLLKEITARKDRSFTAERRAVFLQDNDLPLFEAAWAMADGTWSDPVERFSEFHVLYREIARPAPAFEKIRDVVKNDIVDERAQLWLKAVLRDQVEVGR